MKEKLLITLGCSFTEGVGCWVDGAPNNLDNIPTDTWALWYERSKKSFHENGWPYKLGRLMGFDKTINFGFGASSISGNIKHWFTSEYFHKDLSGYDTTMIWLLPGCLRFSRYTNGFICDIHLTADNDYFKNWILNSKDIDFDVELETKFHVEIMIQECKRRGIELIIFTMDEFRYPELMNFKYYETFIYDSYNKDEYSNCGHLNQKGYTKLAYYMYDILKSNHSNILGNPLPIDIQRKDKEMWVDRKFFKRDDYKRIEPRP